MNLTKAFTGKFVALSLALLGVCAMAVAARQDKPKFEIENNRLKLPNPVIFKTGTDQLAPESEATLNHVKAFLVEKTYITLMRIEGHTGKVADAQNLSEKRALAVARWLIASGVDCKRLLPVGFGNTKPAAPPEMDAQNTRIEFVMAELRNRAIGGMPVDGGGNRAGDLCKAGQP